MKRLSRQSLERVGRMWLSAQLDGVFAQCSALVGFSHCEDRTLEWAAAGLRRAIGERLRPVRIARAEFDGVLLDGLTDILKSRRDLARSAAERAAWQELLRVVAGMVSDLPPVQRSRS
jgi:phage terminase large subunit-like protein